MGLLSLITLLLACWQGRGAVLFYGIMAACIAVLRPCHHRAKRICRVPQLAAHRLPGHHELLTVCLAATVLKPIRRQPVHHFSAESGLDVTRALLSLYLIERPVLYWRNRFKKAQAEPVLAASR
jgi:hypothetical protein